MSRDVACGLLVASRSSQLRLGRRTLLDAIGKSEKRVAERRGSLEFSASRVETARSGDLPAGRFCVESPLQKYFASPVGQIISTNSRYPSPQEGRIAIVTDAGWDAVDAAASGAQRDAGRVSLWNP